MENYKKEEWGAWKIVSDMLDNPDKGIYPTSECYQKLYEFVCDQKEKAKQEERERIECLLIDYLKKICWEVKDIHYLLKFLNK